MVAFVNDVKFTSSTSGTANFGIGAALTGFQTPGDAGAVNGATYSYTARTTAGQFESGTGAYSSSGSGTIARTAGDVTDGSSGAGVLVNFSSAPTVILTLLADDVREKLTADRTYYVRTDGSDSNSGLANTAGGAWLTIQHAYDVIAATLDLGGNDVTVQVGAGTYTAGLVVSQPWTGGGSVRYTGDLTTPSNVFIDTAGDGFSLNGVLPGIFYIGGFKIDAGNFAIVDNAAGSVAIDGTMEYIAAAVAHLATGSPGVFLNVTADYTISGDAPNNLYAGYESYLNVYTDTVTIGAGVDFTQFALAEAIGAITIYVTTFSGTATGQRFLARTNGIIDPNGGSDLTYLPGNAAGTIVTGGVYGAAFDTIESQTLTTTGATQAIDYSLGAYTILNLGHNVTTLTVSNWHPNGTSRLTLEVRNTGAFNITFPTGWLAVGGAAPTITSGNGKKDVIVLTSEDAGTTVYIHTVGQDFSAI